MPTLPPLPGMPDTQTDTSASSRVHVHAHEEAPPPAGHNSQLRPDQVELFRASTLRIRALNREIAARNAQKASVYQTLKGAGIDPDLARKAQALAEMGEEHLRARAEREDQLRYMLELLLPILSEDREDEAPATANAPATPD